MIGYAIQTLVALVGGLAILLRSFNGRYKAASYIVGLLSVPCWVAAEFWYEQWILLPINILYAIGWWRSYKEYKIKRR